MQTQSVSDGVYDQQMAITAISLLILKVYDLQNLDRYSKQIKSQS